MGKGPKHNMAKPRSNGIFKVAGQKFKNEKKGKAKEVTSNIKQVKFYVLHQFFAAILTGLFSQISLKNSKKVADLDRTLLELQKDSVLAGKSLGGSRPVGREVGEEVQKVQRVQEEEMQELADSLGSNT